ncbi:MAG TPA: preprotein translocase subunit SecG [Herpetosiphonaceae bacterium]|nr:preprotein translocase subunit SecG [Herpetosiphonaceae bacterium]
METTLIIGEMILGVALIVIVLLQAKGTSASVFGGRNSSATYRTRRGLEKTLFNLTITLGVAFVLLALLHPILKSL